MTINDQILTNIDLENSDLELSVIRPMHVCDREWSWYHDCGTTPRWPHIVWLVYGGEATLKVDGSTMYQVRRGDAYVLPTSEHDYIGQQNPDDPLDVVWFAFTATDSNTSSVQGGSITGIPMQSRVPEFEACDLILNRLMEASEEARKYWTYCLLHEFRRQAGFESGTSIERKIREAARKVQRQPGDYRGLEDIMTGLHMSKDHFIRKFKEELGVSPGEYLIRCRIDRARSLLSLGDCTVKEAAAELGYSHQSVFSRQFKERIGVSPRVYRMGGGPINH